MNPAPQIDRRELLARLASATAAETLIAARHRDIADYRGGLENWRAAGGRVESDASAGKHLVNEVISRALKIVTQP